MITTPSAYIPGYDKAKRLNPRLAELYVEHTTIGDSLGDDVMDELSTMSRQDENRFITAGMHGNEDILAQAPGRLRDFFDEMKKPPGWLEPSVFDAGRRAFHDHSDLFIPAFFLVTVQNASSLIAKSFHATGRVISGFGLRRIRQNTRHFIEIMLPGSLVDQGDGWRLSVRIRLIHARLRKLIREGGGWNEEAWGAPISAAHQGLASANFSATMLSNAQKLGARMNEETRNSFMQIWRYASWLIGTPESLLFEGDESRTREFQRIADMCEPPPSRESAIIANALVQALPEIAGKINPKQQEKMLKHAYRVARAVLGNELADKLSFPRYHTAGLLQTLRLLRQVYGMTHKAAPNFAGKWRGQNFVFLLEASMLDDLKYQLPDHVRADQSTVY